jgi:hypothetical protein
VIVPLCSFLTDAETRLGRHGTMEIMQHPFFDGTIWETLHSGMATSNRRTVLPHAYAQNSTLRPCISRSSRTTKIYQAHRRLVYPTRSMSKNHLRPLLPHSHFPRSFSHLKKALLRRSRHCAHPPTPSFAKNPSHSSSASHGVQRTMPSPTLV